MASRTQAPSSCAAMWCRSRSAPLTTGLINPSLPSQMRSGPMLHGRFVWTARHVQFFESSKNGAPHFHKHPEICNYDRGQRPILKICIWRAIGPTLVYPQQSRAQCDPAIMRRSRSTKANTPADQLRRGNLVRRHRRARQWLHQHAGKTLSPRSVYMRHCGMI